MLTKALVLTDGEADLLSCVLEEVKTKTFEESEKSLDDTQALDVLVSYFRTAEIEGQRKKGIALSQSLTKAPCVGHDYR